MVQPGERVRFALDHNFPTPVLREFARLLPLVDLVPISDIDKSWAELDDWELFLALHQDSGSWDGLITNDVKLLALAKEMTVLSQTTLTLVVAAGEGDNPIRACGLLLCHLNHIVRHTVRNRAQVWELRVSQKNGEMPNLYLEKIAQKQGTTVAALLEVHLLSARQLRRETP